MTAVQAIKLLLENGDNRTAVVIMHILATKYPKHWEFEEMMLNDKITEEQRQALKAVAEKGNYLESLEALQ